MQAKANAAVAAAQERAYWLERWHVDLNALMRKPGAAQFRALLRAVRWVGRGAKPSSGAFAYERSRSSFRSRTGSAPGRSCSRRSRASHPTRCS